MFKKIIINSIIIFLISSLIHSFYNYLPNFITSIFFSVNESIFEHLKMIFTSYMLFILIIYLFYDNKSNNYIITNFFGALINITIFLVIYLPIKSLFGEIMVLTLIIYFISISITNYFILKLQKKAFSNKTKLLIKIFIIVIYIIFLILTYKPLENNLFLDETNNSYGIYRLNK